MAYDEDLAERIREIVTTRYVVTEHKMFGGLAFMIGGNMVVAASGQGGLLARVDPAESDRLVATTNAEEMVMRGRPMSGWLRVAASDISTDKQLEKWVELSMTYAASLPPKTKKKKTRPK
jgi:TfoX/Sxy family transcriptional regulator of competence genes